MQFQSDILNVEVQRPVVNETTALGAAYLAGLATGFWKDKEDIIKHYAIERTFVPQMEEDYRIQLYKQWQKAVQAAMMFSE